MSKIVFEELTRPDATAAQDANRRSHKSVNDSSPPPPDAVVLAADSSTLSSNHIATAFNIEATMSVAFRSGTIMGRVTMQTSINIVRMKQAAMAVDRQS